VGIFWLWIFLWMAFGRSGVVLLTARQFIAERGRQSIETNRAWRLRASCRAIILRFGRDHVI
jgi:hypothetical protein